MKNKTFDAQKTVIKVSSAGIACNVALFLVKLYIGLSINSISVFSDAINNFADSLSCVLAVICMAIVLSNRKKGSGYVNAKIEQTLSFILSIIVFIVGLYFFYSSLERLFYPTPIWYSQVYFWVIFATVAVKVFMSVMYHVYAKKTGSSTLKVMRTDSIMDSGITLVTLLSFALTRFVDFTVDAFAGMAISVFIVIEAALLTKSSLFGVLNYVGRERRERFEKALSSSGKIKSITYNVVENEKVNCYVEFSESVEPERVADASEEFGIETHIIQS